MDYETFTRDKIAKLRLELEALEKSLKEFESAQARLSGAARRSGGDNPRSGAFGVIMEAIAAAGPEGLTLDQMVEAAAEEGFVVKRNTLRSQIWQAKKDDELEQLAAGQYRVPSRAPIADTLGGDAAPRQANYFLTPEQRKTEFRRTMGLPKEARQDFTVEPDDDEIPV